jgi:signal transduction histidine kinase
MRMRAAQGGSLGLLGMFERAELIGGRLSIDSRPGGGATVRLNLSLAAAPPRRSGGGRPES